VSKNVTIKDIAKLAGVAPSTVSRVVTGRPGVGDEMRAKIWQLIKEHNYRPNSVARSLVKRRLETIGILVPRGRTAFFENPFFADVLMGATEAAAQENFDVLVYTGSREKKGARVLQERKVDGLLAVGLREDDASIPLIKEELTTVFVNRQIKDAAWVSVDNKEGVSKAVAHLIELGHRQIGFIGGPEKMEISELRKAGYLDAHRKFGLAVRPEYMAAGNFDEESGYAAATKILNSNPRPTAIFAANDLMAIGALKAAKNLSLVVPDDLSLCGFDNIHSSSHTDPPLSTVKLPAFQMGQLACQLLLQLIRGEEPEARQLLLPTELIVRQSSGKVGE